MKIRTSESQVSCFSIWLYLRWLIKLTDIMYQYLHNNLQKISSSTWLVATLFSQKVSVVARIDTSVQFSSVTQSWPTLWPHGLQHTRLPCPSPTPGACSNSCPLSRWCHPTISSSVVPSVVCLQSFPLSFPLSQSSYQVAKVLELHHQPFKWVFRTDFL